MTGVGSRVGTVALAVRDGELVKGVIDESRAVWNGRVSKSDVDRRERLDNLKLLASAIILIALGVLSFLLAERVKRPRVQCSPRMDGSGIYCSCRKGLSIFVQESSFCVFLHRMTFCAPRAQRCIPALLLIYRMNPRFSAGVSAWVFLISQAFQFAISMG